MSRSSHNSFIQKLFKPFASTPTRDQNEVDLEIVAAREQKSFSFEALVAATNNFHHKLGEGGFGPVFKGKLKDGRVVAVKRLSQRSGQGKTEFQNEAKLLARVQHKNVVNFVGYCVHESERLLVYEYVAHESLDKLLFKFDKRELLDWKRRYGVITGVAKGLLYLHDQAHCSIIHRDIKASNILLDDNFVPKIADFGMARLFPDGQTHVNTRIAGTNGYMAPEYLFRGLLSKKADVFSFGVVVLELISGQKNSSFNRDPDCNDLLDWAYKLFKKQRSLEVMDPTLASSADCEQIETCVHIGLLCVQTEPQLRPDMDRVVTILSRKPSDLEEPSRPRYPGSSQRRYRRRENGSTVTENGSTVSGTSDRSSSGSFGTTNSQTAGTSSYTATRSDPHGKRASTSGYTATRSDPHGKRPVKD